MVVNESGDRLEVTRQWVYTFTVPGPKWKSWLKQYIKCGLNALTNPDIVVVYDQDDQFHKALATTLEDRQCPKAFLVIALAEQID